jgi:hypothetical protein
MANNGTLCKPYSTILPNKLDCQQLLHQLMHQTVTTE